MLPAHEIAGRRKQDGINDRPGDENTEVKADTGVEVEKDLMGCFDDYGQKTLDDGLLLLSRRQVAW